MKLFRHLYELWPHDLLPLIIITVALSLMAHVAWGDMRVNMADGTCHVPWNTTDADQELRFPCQAIAAQHTDGTYSAWWSGTLQGVSRQILDQDLSEAGSDGLVLGSSVHCVEVDGTIVDKEGELFVTDGCVAQFEYCGIKEENSLRYPNTFDAASWSTASQLVLTVAADTGAWTLADVGGTELGVLNVARLYGGDVISNDTDSWVWSLSVKKTSGAPTVFPVLGVTLNDGTPVHSLLSLNTTTGATAEAPSEDWANQVIDASWVEDSGDYWRVFGRTHNNGSGNTTIRPRFYPAYSSTLGGAADGAAIGSQTIRQFEVRRGPLYWDLNMKMLLSHAHLATTSEAIQSVIAGQSVAVREPPVAADELARIFGVSRKHVCETPNMSEAIQSAIAGQSVAVREPPIEGSISAPDLHEVTQ